MATADFRDRLLQCLGGDWPAPVPLNVRVRETFQRDGVQIESLVFDVFPGDSVPALLLIPAGVDAAHAAPAIAVWHQHNGEWNLGKSEPAGLAGNPMHHTGLGARSTWICGPLPGRSLF